MFSTVLTIGYIPYEITQLLNSNSGHLHEHLGIKGSTREFNIHLIGADVPEVTAVESGLIQVQHKYRAL